MINPDELEPRKVGAKPRDLQPMSVTELEAYISALQDEILRVEQAIAKKSAHRNDIDALFGGKP